MTTKAKKDSIVWLEELVEAAKAWRLSLTDQDLIEARNERATDAHAPHVLTLAESVDGWRQAIKDEVEAEEKELENG
jgi:hypothetical protein